MIPTAPFPKLRRGLVAILHGLKPEEAVAMGQASFEAGIEAIEVPLNSPDPLASISRLVEALPETALIGTGTVLSAADVDGLHKAGGRLLVSPNIDADVMRRGAHHHMVTMPGVFPLRKPFRRSAPFCPPICRSEPWAAFPTRILPATKRPAYRSSASAPACSSRA